MRIAIAILLLMLSVPAAAQTGVPCGNGRGPLWFPAKDIGAVNGVRFWIAVTQPQCVGDLQDVAVYVQNTTDRRVAIRFEVEATTLDGRRGTPLPGGLPVRERAGGPPPGPWLQMFSPLRELSGVPIDPNLLLRSVTVKRIGVCPTPIGGDPSTYHGCPPGPNSLSWAPDCPSRAGDPAYGYTPLMLAAQENEVGTALLLITCGSNVNARASDGYTALMFAANAGAIHIADALLRAGANVNTRQDRGLTALGIVDDTFPEMTALLRRHGGQR
jgi:Ankyrin repeats (3 copies)